MARRENGAGTEPKQEANGRWWLKVSYRDVDTGELKRSTIRGATQKEVLDKKKELLKSVESGVKPTAKKITLDEWLDTWLEVNKKGIVASNTYSGYRVIVDKHIKGTTIGKTVLDKIKRADLQKFLNEKRKSVSPGYVNRIKIVINDALNVAEMDKLILNSPCKKLKLPKIDKKEINPFTPEEVKILLEAAANDVTYNSMYIITFLALHTGMRRGEICGLLWTDIDFKNKQIIVRQQAKKEITDNKGNIILGGLKTESSYRTIPIYDRLVDLLKWHRAKQNKFQEFLGIKDADLNLVFCEPDGSIINPSTLTSRFINLMKKTEVPYRNFHQLRHTFASVALSQGYNIKAISAILGHAKTSMTLDVYGHLMPGDAETVVKGVASFYGL